MDFAEASLHQGRIVKTRSMLQSFHAWFRQLLKFSTGAKEACKNQQSRSQFAHRGRRSYCVFHRPDSEQNIVVFT